MDQNGVVTPNRPTSRLERAELSADDKGEHKELAAIYVGRALVPALAKQVADQLMAHDAIGAHARDELGISETLRARPMQAACASARAASPLEQPCLPSLLPYPGSDSDCLRF